MKKQTNSRHSGARCRARRQQISNHSAGRGDLFECKSCGRQVVGGGAGSEHRNHCPYCLCSRHLDVEPGDRAADCGGMMDPVAVWVRKNGEWAIVHRCRVCGAFSSNRIAADDNEYALLSIATRPIANPPFPLDRLPE